MKKTKPHPKRRARFLKSHLSPNMAKHGFILPDNQDYTDYPQWYNQLCDNTHANPDMYVSTHFSVRWLWNNHYEVAAFAGWDWTFTKVRGWDKVMAKYLLWKLLPPKIGDD